MKLKSILAAAMVSLLAVGAIAGCGGDKKKAADSGTKYKLSIGMWLPRASVALL